MRSTWNSTTCYAQREALQVTAPGADDGGMSVSPTDPTVLLAIFAGTAGALLLVQARVQARLLRRRIATGAGAVVVDPATGLWSSSAAWQCIRAEANRALRLGRQLDVWIGTASDGPQLDEHGRALVFDMPSGAMGIRIDERSVCVLSCAGPTAEPTKLAADLQWRTATFEPGEHAAVAALAFVSQEAPDA